MRLLQRDDTDKYSLTPDLAPGKVPPYAILSHRWGPDEVIFADLARLPGDWQGKAGFEKIKFCADQAARHGLHHFWVDTCCIDKSDGVEYQNAVNSMFRWYYNAKRCYVYLPDVSSTPESSPSQGLPRWKEAFRNSDWFTRGWTLQELIAPSTVDFYSKEGAWLGDKRSLEPMIRDITGIPANALRGAPLSDFTVAERKAWVCHRQTTREEDMAYSLQGIFGVFISCIYGEGRDNAERRLWEEVEKAVRGTGTSDFSVTFSLSEAPEIQYFTARESELAKMHRLLKTDGSRRVVVLHGLGGIGKTQLAVAYAKRYRDDYTATLWFNIKDEASIQQSFTNVARQILQQHSDAIGLSALNLQQDYGKVVEAVKAWLSLPGNTRWLAIYDNYDNPKLGDQASQGEIDIKRFLPAAYQGSIAITTRLSEVDLGHSIRIKKLESTEDSLQILSRMSGRGGLQDDIDAKKLAEKLDGLPLALATAGAYLRRVAISCGDYLRLYEESWARLHESTPRLGSYQDRTLCSTWQLSYEQVQQRNPLAANLLRWWAYFDNEDLWYELVRYRRRGAHDQAGCSTTVTKPSTSRRFRTRLHDALRRVKITRSRKDIQQGIATNASRPPDWVDELADRINFDDAMGTLHDYGFVEIHVPATDVVESRGYSIHSCLHSWTVHILNGERAGYLRKLAAKCVASRVPSKNKDQFWLLQTRLLSHAMQTYAMIREGDEDQDWVFFNLGHLYETQGKFQEAEEMYLRALRGYEKAWGPDHPSTLNTVHNLGDLYDTQGKIQEAEEMYLRALRGYEKAWGPDHPSTLNTVNNLGVLYDTQGKIQKAEEMYLRALRGYEKAWGPDHPSTLDTVNNLGILYQVQGKVQKAEEMLLRALQGKEKGWGPDHPSTLKTVNNLGNLYQAQGKIQKAEKMLLRALQGKEKAWGPDHPSTLDTVHNLGILYRVQGKVQKAEEMYLRALQGREKAWGPDHPSTLDTVHNLGNLCQTQGKIQKAEEMYLRALRGYEKAMTPQDITRYRRAIDSLCSMGALLYRQGKLADAKGYYQRAYKNLADLLGASHPDVQELQGELHKLDQIIM